MPPVHAKYKRLPHTSTMPNVERERWEPAATDAGIGTDLNGWPPSTPRFGSALSFLVDARAVEHFVSKLPQKWKMVIVEQPPRNLAL